jgi:hypothetical protein
MIRPSNLPFTVPFLRAGMSLLHRLRRLFQPSPSVAVASVPVASQVAEPNRDYLFSAQLAAAIQTHLPQLSFALSGNQLTSSSLTLTCLVGDRQQHPQAVVYGLEVRAYQAAYFPKGLVDYLAGIGADDATAFTNAAHNYATGILLTIMEALSAAHSPALDFYGRAGLRKWHPLVGLLQVQGAWAAKSDSLDDNHFLRLFQPHLAKLFDDQPCHWLKIYASKMPSGEFIGDCLLNNEPWATGLALLEQEVSAWETAGQFAGQKQFLLFRQCALTTARPA